MTAMIVEELARIPMSPHLAATLTRAADYAVAQAHAEVTLEHLLLALAEDQEAAIVLTTSSVDLGRLGADVSDYLSRSEHPPADGQGPRISMDLRRILEAAAAAAQQGRRREINGAIVLAAIVGDGKSAAAHILRAQGLTFEEAIKALQRVVTAPRTEDILASARERVQSRSITPPQSSQPGREAPSPGLDQPLPAPTPQAAPQDTYAEPALPMPEPQGGAAGPHLDAPGWAPPSQQVPPQRGPFGAPQPQPAPPPSAGAGRIAIPRANHTPAPMPNAQPVAREGQRPGGLPGAGFPAQGLPGPGPAFPPPIPSSSPAGDMMGSDMMGGAPEPEFELQVPPQAPSQAPWADPSETHHTPPAAIPRQPAQAPSAPPSAATPAPPARRRAAGSASPFPGPIAQVENGQLVENIPRKMRRGIPIVAEARIGRADLKALTEGLQGGGAAYHHEVVVTKAMSVRLRAPEGGFWIEPRSPETQWIENILGLSSEEYASWRWTVTPRTSGKKQLQIIVSARTIGADGMTADTALPDQIIDVKVGINYGETARRLIGWTAAAIAGGVLARFGDGIFEMAQNVVTRIASGN